MAECCVMALKAIFQYDFQTSFSRLHALSLLVRQSYRWGMATASWQLLHRALLEIPGEQHSSWVCSLANESGHVFVLMPCNEMPWQTTVVFWSSPFSWRCAISKRREQIFIMEGDAHKQILTGNKRIHVQAESQEVTLRGLQPAATTLCAMPGVWPLKYWGDRRTELLVKSTDKTKDPLEKEAKFGSIYRWLTQKYHPFIGCLLDSDWSNSPWSQWKYLQGFQWAFNLAVGNIFPFVAPWFLLNCFFQDCGVLIGSRAMRQARNS